MNSHQFDFNEFIDETHDDLLIALSLQVTQQENDDYAFAKRLQQQYHEETQVNEEIDSRKQATLNENIVSQDLELTDPHPDIWLLMRQFDDRFFGGILSKNCIELSWSKKMTRTAGLCAWNPKTNYCSIRLSLPLLQLRSRRDLVETLIHEMIHALLFVTRQDDNHESHGPKFHEHMYRINKASGTNITVYHNFHDEVNHYLTHVWRCDGICRNKKPYYGFVKRSMNRKPGPYDYWFSYHQSTCGGTFIKISEPKIQEKSGNKRKETPTPEELMNHDIRKYIRTNSSTQSHSKIIPFSGVGVKLGSSLNVSSCDSQQTKSNLMTSQTKKPKQSKINFPTKIQPKTNTLSSPTSSINNDLPVKHVTSTTFVPFSGRGHVLGNIKLESSPVKVNMNERGDNQLNTRLKPAEESNIQVIELD